MLIFNILFNLRTIKTKMFFTDKVPMSKLAFYQFSYHSSTDSLQCSMMAIITFHILDTRVITTGRISVSALSMISCRRQNT